MAYTTIDKATSFFNTKVYSGTGASNAITGVGFEPAMTWTKATWEDASHYLVDSVRGATKQWRPESTIVEATDAEGLKSFDSDGYTLGTTSGFNNSSGTFVSWNWKAGTTTGITGSPSITPASYSFNATSGFSIIKYVGTGVAGTLPHGLGVAPKFITIKNLDTAGGSFSYHHKMASDAETDYMNWNTTANAADHAGPWNDTAPTSTLFSIGTIDEVNKVGDNIVAYCFADVQGFSKFGGYTGNGVSSYSNRSVGPFIYTGFKPSYVVIKQATGTGTNGWYILDNKRAGYNPDNENLLINTNAAEDATNNFLDLYSNGFKIKTTGGIMNGSGSTYIYCAFGQALVGGNGVVVTAR